MALREGHFPGAQSTAAQATLRHGDRSKGRANSSDPSKAERPQIGANATKQRGTTMLRVILIVILILLLIGALPTWPYSGGWGYYPTGGIGLLLIIVIILLLIGYI